MMLLADENVPLPLVNALRRAGHDVVWAGDQLAQTPDAELVAHANVDNRFFLTFDVRLAAAVHDGTLRVERGLILLRVPTTSQSALNTLVIEALKGAPTWGGRYVVVTP